MADLLLGIDIGTSACKAAVFTLDGQVAAQCSEEYEVFYPQPGWAEQNPDDWWKAVCASIQRIGQQGIPLEEVRAVGIDGQSWSAIPMDREGQVLHPTPIWFDTRAEGICRELKNRIPEKEIFDLCGNPLQAAYTLPKILWFQKYHPEIYEHTYQFLQSNSFIVYRLTGEFTQDRSQGYGLQCYDIQKGEWDLSMCSRMGIDPQKLPKLFDCHEIVGTVTARASEETGLLEGVPVAAGGLDAACGTLGAGVIRDGETQEQGGQAGGMSICMESFHSDPRLILSHHVVPGTWLLQGGSVGGGGVMRWISQELGAAARMQAEKNGTSQLYELDREAEMVSPGADGVVFLPYMAGERSPIWNPRAKGVFFGLDYSKTRGHMIRAAMEGVGFSLRHNLQVAEEAGVRVSQLRAQGGAANSRLWTQMKADITGKEILVPGSDTAGALGAAILAGVGAGLYQSFEEAVSRTVTIRRSHKPAEENRPIYEEAYRQYRYLYENLKPMMSDKEEQ